MTSLPSDTQQLRPLVSTQSVRRQLQRRVFILGLTSVLGFTLALILTVLFELQRLEVELEAVGRQAAVSFDRVLGDISRDLEATGGAIAIMELNEQDVRNLLRRALDRQSSVLELSLVEPDGRVLVQRRRVFKTPEAFLDPAPWLDTLRRGEIYIGVVEFQEFGNTSVPFVDLAVPILRERELDYALLARVDLSSLWSEVTSQQVGKQGYVFITETGGQLLVYRDLMVVRNGTTLESMVGLTPQQIAAPGLDFYRGLSGVQVVGASLPLQTVAWFAVVERPTKEALGPLILRSALLSVPIVLLLVLVSGILLFTRKRIVLPLQRLQEGVTALSEGRLDYRIDTREDFEPEDEFGNLASTFNQLAAQLRRNIERLEGRLEELKCAQEALQDARDTLEKRVQERTADLKRANEEMRSLVYLVSHDLRAPLINLKGFAGELREAQAQLRASLTPALTRLDAEERSRIMLYLDEEIPEALSFIESAASRMDSFTSSLLKLSRAGHRELTPEKIDVERLVQDLLKALGYQIEQQGIEVTVGTLPSVVADPLALEQVLGNLLNNAIAYLSPDRPGRIEVWGQQTEAQTTFGVKDNGRGISEEDLPKIFLPFRRLGQINRPGEGMGLTYAQALVRRHRGRIWCRSEQDRGSEFIFSIPTHPLPEEPTQTW